MEYQIDSSLYQRCSCSLWDLQRETERKEEKREQQQLKWNVFHVEAPSGFDNKRGSLSPAATRQGSSPVTVESSVDRQRKHSLQRAFPGLDQGDRHLRDPALVTHLPSQIRVFC